MTGPRDAAGFVLVGGRSSRMGVDKALLSCRGVPLAAHVASRLKVVTDAVSLVGDPARYGHLGFPVIADEHPGMGPVGAIITALLRSGFSWNLVAACDLPGLHGEIFEALLHRIQASGRQCVVPVTPDGREQVLCSVYRRDSLDRLAAIHESGERKLRNAVRFLDTEFWRVDSSDWSRNVNTPQDWAAFTRQEA
jgi:molybdopterin-guanine dinucleotide biosynthesis protein A